MYKPSPEEIAKVKGMGFLVDKTTMCHFNGRVLTVNGKTSADKPLVIAEASKKFGVRRFDADGEFFFSV